MKTYDYDWKLHKNKDADRKRGEKQRKGIVLAFNYKLIRNQFEKSRGAGRGFVCFTPIKLFALFN